MGTEMLGAHVVVGLRGTAGELEMCLDLNDSEEQCSTPKQQQQQPAMEGMTHLMLTNCTFHSLMKNQNMPKMEMETWLSKTVLGTPVGTAKHFGLILPCSFSSKS